MLVALIPAYNPIASLPQYIRDLQVKGLFAEIVVLNDGSREEYGPLFAEVAKIRGVTVLQHVVNRGKGAALKTGLNHIACHCQDLQGIVTIDADGQHRIEDACHVGQALLAEPNTLILGGRRFDKDTPIKSWLGNFFTRHSFRLITGLNLFDTQTGLRGIPASMIKDLLLLESNAYEFELDMLIHARHWGFGIREVPITTLYFEGNKHSSFRPLRDSLRIYFVLLRFSIVAILSALVDYGIFICIYYLIHPSVLLALVGGRAVSLTFNYFNVRHYAFRAHASHWQTLPKYLALALFSGATAWALIVGFMNLLGWHVVAAKIVAEIIMFAINFLIQRDFIFVHSKFCYNPGIRK